MGFHSERCEKGGARKQPKTVIAFTSRAQDKTRQDKTPLTGQAQDVILQKGIGTVSLELHFLLTIHFINLSYPYAFLCRIFLGFIAPSSQLLGLASQRSYSQLALKLTFRHSNTPFHFAFQHTANMASLI